MKYTDDQCRWAQRRLLDWQPKADNMQFEECHCRKRGLMISYQLESDEHKPYKYNATTGEDRETCGYWCVHCKFGNAGSRLVK